MVQYFAIINGLATTTYIVVLIYMLVDNWNANIAYI